MVTGISPYFLITAGISACILAFGFVINIVADVEIDRQHVTKCETNKNPRDFKTVTNGGTRVLLTLLALIPLGISLFPVFLHYSAS